MRRIPLIRWNYGGDLPLAQRYCFRVIVPFVWLGGNAESYFAFLIVLPWLAFMKVVVMSKLYCIPFCGEASGQRRLYLTSI